MSDVTVIFVILFTLILSLMSDLFPQNMLQEDNVHELACTIFISLWIMAVMYG